MLREKSVNELKKKVKEFIKRQKRPFSINDVAREFKISWTTARALLLELALEGEVEVMKTTKSYIFIPKRGDSNENREKSER